MKPLDYRPRNPHSIFNRILKLFIRFEAERPSGYRSNHKAMSPDSTSGDDTEGNTEYYHLTRSDVANSDVGKTPSEEEEVEL